MSTGREKSSSFHNPIIGSVAGFSRSQIRSTECCPMTRPLSLFPVSLHSLATFESPSIIEVRSRRHKDVQVSSWKGGKSHYRKRFSKVFS